MVVKYFTSPDINLHIENDKREICCKITNMTDLLLDDTADLVLVNGDFAIGNTDNQNQKLIVIANKGEWKEFPEVGVGIQNILSDDDPTDVLIECKRQLEYDGMQIDDVSLTQDGKLIIDGNYPQ